MNVKTFFVCFLLGISAALLRLPAQSLAVSEINFNSDSTTTSGDWIELFNYGSAPLDISMWQFKDDNNQHVFTIPSGTVLAPGDRLVLINDSVKFKSRYPFVTNYVGNFNFGLGNDGDHIRLYDASQTLRIFIAYADTAPWHPAAAGTGRTLELRDPYGDPNDPTNWFVGCMFGSPGKNFTPCWDQLIFSEINYNPNPLLNAGEWLELYNRGPGYVNLNGWTFKDRKDDNIFVFPLNINLPPQGRLVIAGDLALFQSVHPQVSNVVGPFNFNLSNDGEILRLFDHTGKIRFSMAYNDAGDWPKGADGGGYTLEFSDTTWNVNNPKAWFQGCLGGSPGTAYDPDCTTGLFDATALNTPLIQWIAPNQLWVQLPDAERTPHTMVIVNMTGQCMWKAVVAQKETVIDCASWPVGIYFVSINSANYRTTQKITVHY